VNKDAAFLNHIREETKFILKTCNGLEREDLMRNELLQRAVLRSLEVIGEAVKNISEELKQRHPELEWRKITGLRDKLIHHYFGVDWIIVWDVITTRIPGLYEQIEQLVEEEKREKNRQPLGER
jgi:uncharacterized protein with HEPN domain